MNASRLALLLMLPLGAFADCTARSGAATTPLVELYTSEGCSSCPPADRWISTLRTRAASQAVVPVAFHVDYWNGLGWKDAYAEARHSERQRDLARAVGARYVYTPQVVLAGRDFSAWRGGDATSAFDAVRAQPARANLEIAASGTSARVSASLVAGARAEDLALLVAITQDGLLTRVRAGENRGETLLHDFVVRDIESRRGWSAAPAPKLEADVKFTPRPDWQLSSMRFVAFVQDLRTGEVLQALSTPACLR